ncbi:MAG: diguanylate cyclase [Sphingomonas sp.]
MTRFATFRILEPIIVGAIYFLTASATIVTTRFDGGVACIWIANAILIAALSSRSRDRWVPLLIACGLASILATVVFGVGLAGSLPLAAANLLEATLSAILLDRFGSRRSALDSVERLVAFLAAAGLIAPAIGATIAAATMSWLTLASYSSNWVGWFAGHALGTLSFAPVATLGFTGDVRRWVAAASTRRRRETALLLLAVAMVSLAVFSQQSLPILFLPILPVILATFRIGRLGAAGSVVVVAVIGGVLTMRGYGPINLMHGGVADHARFFQFYLASTVLTALPVAADLTRRRGIFQLLRDSEARYRLLADNSTDIVMNLAPDGAIQYASPSVAQLGGYDPAALIGRNAIDLVTIADRSAVAETHRSALERPEATFIVEYRAMTGNGELRWFESHTRGVVDDEGHVAGAVSAIRDISHRKTLEAELKRAAATDPLTGLANRRAFDAELARAIGMASTSGVGGCVAVFDLDHFKAVNDQHGHEAGDRVLAAFAQIARAFVRKGDLVGRRGGEEFGVILPCASADQARYVCDRLRAAVGEMTLRIGGASVTVTSSVGVARFDGTSTPPAVLRAADGALYCAKAEGRDRLRLAA